MLNQPTKIDWQGENNDFGEKNTTVAALMSMSQQ